MSIDEITNYQNVDNIAKIALKKLTLQNEKHEIEKSILELLFISNIMKRYDLLADIYLNIKNKNIDLDIYEFEIILGEFIQLNNENFVEISKILNKLEFESSFLEIIRFISFDLNKEKYAEEVLKKILKNREWDNPYVKIELAYGLLKYNINENPEKIENVMDIFLEKDFNKCQLLKHSSFCEDAINNYNANLKLRKNCKYMYIILNILEYCIKSDLVSETQIYEIYEIFELELPKLTSSIYNKKNINEKTLVIYPPIIRFGYFLNEAKNYKIKGEKIGYIQMLKKAVRHYPYMEIVISDILKKLEDEIIVEDQRKKEFEELSVKIKQKIYELIALGQKEEALSVICQLQSIIPKDKELKEIKSRLSIF